MHASISVIGHYISRCLLPLLFQSPIECSITLLRCFVILSFLTHWGNSLKRSLERDYNITSLHLTLFILINWVDLNSTQLLIQILSSLILFIWIGPKVLKQVYWPLTSSSFSFCWITNFFLWFQTKPASILEFYLSFPTI